METETNGAVFGRLTRLEELCRGGSGTACRLVRSRKTCSYGGTGFLHVFLVEMQVFQIVSEQSRTLHSHTIHRPIQAVNQTSLQLSRSSDSRGKLCLVNRRHVSSTEAVDVALAHMHTARKTTDQDRHETSESVKTRYKPCLGNHRCAGTMVRHRR